MKLIINGESKEFGDRKSMKEILEELKIESKTIAIALNSKLVRKEEYHNTTPNNGDRIEFLQFMGGG